MCTVGEFHHDENGEEAEEVPEDFSELSLEQQQVAILKRAFTLLAMGTFLVVLFSDPMVEVLQEVANRINVSPFYVPFVLAPLASNSSKVIASIYYAGKKTRKTITVSMTTLEGAASMNNTFCLSILLGLIYFRGLVWAYTAETIAIVLHIDAFIKKRKNYFFEITLHLSGM
jgi:Ca2+/Na+ antiporter